jgi:hypothetical protein
MADPVPDPFAAAESFMLELLVRQLDHMSCMRKFETRTS